MGAVVVRVIATASAVLATGLAAALGGLGWRIDTGHDPGPDVLTVLVLDEGAAARVPTPHSAGTAPTRTPDVCIGTLRSLPTLLVQADRGAVVLNSDTPFPLLVRLVDQALRDRGSLGAAPADLRRRAAEAAALARLTPQEHQVLHALMSGASAADIAAASHRSLHTIRSHIRSVLTKLGVSSQPAAIAVAARSGPPTALLLERAQFTNSGDSHPGPPRRR